MERRTLLLNIIVNVAKQKLLIWLSCRILPAFLYY